MSSAAAGIGKIPAVEDKITHHLRRHRIMFTVFSVYVIYRQRV